MNTTASTWITVIIALLIGVGTGYWWAGSHSSSARGASSNAVTATGTSDKEVALYATMRKLWADHVFWTREYITEFADGNTAEAKADADRLMKNQEDIGAAMSQYYGKSAGDQLTTLLKEHISIAVDILNDAKANDTAKFNADNKKWQDNGDQIADLLSKANPNLPDATLRDMMKKHLQTTLDEAKAALGKDYAGSVTAFDKVFDHINMMADALSAGIIKQFPDKFQ